MRLPLGRIRTHETDLYTRLEDNLTRHRGDRLDDATLGIRLPGTSDSNPWLPFLRGLYKKILSHSSCSQEPSPGEANPSFRYSETSRFGIVAIYSEDGCRTIEAHRFFFF